MAANPKHLDYISQFFPSVRVVELNVGPGASRQFCQAGNSREVTGRNPFTRRLHVEKHHKISVDGWLSLPGQQQQQKGNKQKKKKRRL